MATALWYKGKQKLKEARQVPKEGRLTRVLTFSSPAGVKWKSKHPDITPCLPSILSLVFPTRGKPQRAGVPTDSVQIAQSPRAQRKEVKDAEEHPEEQTRCLAAC